MTRSTWTKPEFNELNLSAEIGMYCEASGDAFDALSQACAVEPAPTQPAQEA